MPHKIFTARNSSWRKAMFSQVSVNLFTRECVSLVPDPFCRVSLVPCPFWGVSLDQVLSWGWVSLVPGPFWGLGMCGTRSFGGGWVCLGVCPRGGYVQGGCIWWVCPPGHWTWDTMGYGWQAGSMHPTGMLSCYQCMCYAPITHSSWSIKLQL